MLRQKSNEVTLIFYISLQYLKYIHKWKERKYFSKLMNKKHLFSCYFNEAFILSSLLSKLVYFSQRKLDGVLLDKKFAVEGEIAKLW